MGRFVINLPKNIFYPADLILCFEKLKLFCHCLKIRLSNPLKQFYSWQPNNNAKYTSLIAKKRKSYFFPFQKIQQFHIIEEQRVLAIYHLRPKSFLCWDSHSLFVGRCLISESWFNFGTYHIKLIIYWVSNSGDNFGLFLNWMQVSSNLK